MRSVEEPTRPTCSQAGRRVSGCVRRASHKAHIPRQSTLERHTRHSHAFKAQAACKAQTPFEAHPRETRARSMMSIRRPGVATRNSHPRSSSRSCNRGGAGQGKDRIVSAGQVRRGGAGVGRSESAAGEDSQGQSSIFTKPAAVAPPLLHHLCSTSPSRLPTQPLSRPPPSPHLLLLRGASVDDHGAHACEVGELAGLVIDLGGELAGGGQHQGQGEGLAGAAQGLEACRERQGNGERGLGRRSGMCALPPSPISGRQRQRQAVPNASPGASSACTHCPLQVAAQPPHTVMASWWASPHLRGRLSAGCCQ